MAVECGPRNSVAFGVLSASVPSEDVDKDEALEEQCQDLLD